MFIRSDHIRFPHWPPRVALDLHSHHFRVSNGSLRVFKGVIVSLPTWGIESDPGDCYGLDD